MILTMESGMLVTYSQNFTVKKERRAGAAQGLSAPSASAEFDFYTARIREDRYLTPQTVTRQFRFPDRQRTSAATRRSRWSSCA